MTEESLDDSVETEIVELASSIPGVVNPHNLRTRRLGGIIAVDLHVRVAADMHVSDAHAIASKIEDRIRARFGQSSFVSIHIEPLFKDEMPTRIKKTGDTKKTTGNDEK